MFHNSTQRKYWMFKSEDEIVSAQKKVHNDFIMCHGIAVPQEKLASHFLTFEEAKVIRVFYEKKLVEFCKQFKPPMPKSVLGTSLQFYKRFYINNSVMDYHPKEILVTAAYLACKVEEFNVSIEQFIANIKGNKERAMEIVLNSELLLVKELGFHLTIHNPYRPVEGLLIDLKARCQTLKNAESLRTDIDSFLSDIGLTNASLIYAPSQIALAALTYAASKNGENIDTYVTNDLFGNCEETKLNNIIDAVRNIRLMAKGVPNVDPGVFNHLQEKLEACRNQDNNPDSQKYKRKIQELLNDDDDEKESKHMKMDEDFHDPTPLSSD